MGGDEIPLPLSAIQERELTVTGTFRYANTWPTAIGLVASGRVDLDRLVTGSYGLDQVEEALSASRRDPHTIKPMVHPQKTG
jgi:L-iditol 2-dehydrogenase